MKQPSFIREVKALFIGFDDRLSKQAFRINPWQLAMASLMINILSLALPLTAMQVYDRIIARNSVDTLYVLVVGVVVAVLFEAILRTTRAWLTGWLGASREHALYSAAMQHVLEKDLGIIENRGAGYNAEELASIGKMREFYSGQAMITLVDMPFILVFLALIVHIAGHLAFVPVLLMSVFVLRAWKSGNKLKTALRQREQDDEQRYDFIVETLSGIHTVKSYGAEEMMLRRYEELESTSAVANLAVAHASGDAYNDGALFSQVMSISMILIGTHDALAGTISMGALVACVLLAGRMMQPIQRCLSLWSRFQDQRLAHEKISALFTDAPASVSNMSILKAPKAEAAIELLHVGFSFGGSHCFYNCNLQLGVNEVVAVQGVSGSGKSALLKMIAGLYQPASGEILVQGRSIHDFAQGELAESIGYLAAESTIFQGSIRDNLTGFGATSEEQMYEIAQLLGIDTQVAKLPQGYETMLENTPADPIPPGLKQRITIARALAHKPRILLFDNADRALDRESYGEVHRLLSRLKGQISMLIISSDNNMLSLADRTLEIADGALHEIAGITHQTLINRTAWSMSQ